MRKFKCLICNLDFEVADGEIPICPKCQAKDDKLKELSSSNKYSGTKTEKNLELAFAGESQARNKYTYFASKAKKEGFEQISALFLNLRKKVRSVRPALVAICKTVVLS